MRSRWPAPERTGESRFRHCTGAKQATPPAGSGIPARRATCVCNAATIYVENPNTHPPAIEASSYALSIGTSQTRPIRPAPARVGIRYCKLTTGPNAQVIGTESHPASGTVVAQARLTPTGAKISLVRKGLMRWVAAYAHQSRNQINAAESGPRPIYQVEKWPTSPRPKRRNEVRKIKEKRTERLMVKRARIRALVRHPSSRSGRTGKPLLLPIGSPFERPPPSPRKLQETCGAAQHAALALPSPPLEFPP